VLALEGLELTLADGSFYFLVLIFCISGAWSLVVLVFVLEIQRWKLDRMYRRVRERENLRQQFHNRR